VVDGCLYLGGERQRVRDGGNMQFVAVEDLFQLRGHGVQAPGHGGGEEERSGQDPGVEVDPEQECTEPARIRGRRTVRDRFGR
jgi:hypothetical protein